MRMRLGVLPGPVGEYGPRSVAIAIAGSVPRPRMRPRVTLSSSASERSTNVIPTRCGPAASGARNVTCSLLRREDSRAGDAGAVDAELDLVRLRHRGRRLELDHVLGVERQIRLNAQTAAGAE